MKTILLVDDEYALVENLTELLEEEGYRVVSASNGKDGLAMLDKERPDLVVTDLMMPISDGKELVRGVKALPAFRAVPIVMMSATTKEVALADGTGVLEVSMFVKKPLRWEKLLEAIVGLIGPAGR
jgi:CheY-like chemotaxis protein